MRLLLLLLISLFYTNIFATELLEVNLELPEDKQIWPLPLSNSKIVINAIFKNSKMVTEIMRGSNRIQLIHITYEVIKVEKGNFQPKHISFIIYDFWPSNRGIKLKKRAFPFKPKSQLQFWLNPKHSPSKIDIEHGEKELWEIKTYKVLNK